VTPFVLVLQMRAWRLVFASLLFAMPAMGAPTRLSPTTGHYLAGRWMIVEIAERGQSCRRADDTEVYSIFFQGAAAWIHVTDPVDADWSQRLDVVEQDRGVIHLAIRGWKDVYLRPQGGNRMRVHETVGGGSQVYLDALAIRCGRAR
jgi:hypothetical protein